MSWQPTISAPIHARMRRRLYGTVHLYADGQELTHTNKLPATFDIVDTLRAQYELVEAVEADGAYCGVPFCCCCSDRGCTSVQWDVSVSEDDLRIRMADLLDQRIADSPYRISRTALYTGIHDLCESVLAFCGAHDIETFGWADRMEPPVAGRDQYATVSELRTYERTLQDLVDA